MTLTRRSFLAAGGAAALAGAAAWPLLVEPDRLVVRRRAFAFPEWPQDYGRLRVAFITDLHVGCPSVDLAKVEQIVALTNAERPDVVLLGGDYVIQEVLGGTFVPPDDIGRALAGLRAPLGAYSVLGNHDWYLDGGLVRSRLEANGIAVLENQAVRLGGDRPLWIAGVADDMTRSPDVPRTLAQISDRAPVLALAHDPATFADMPEGPLLTLCGHTHGGQIRLPFLGAPVIPGRAPRRWAYGHIVEGGRQLLVSGGVGTSILPARFNVPPEIMILDIGPPADPAGPAEPPAGDMV